MPDTALELLATITDQLGLARPPTVTQNATQTRQLLSFLNETMLECVREVEWAGLQDLYVIEIGAPTVITATLTLGSAIVTTASTAAFAANPGIWALSGEGVQNAARIDSVTNATTFVMDEVATEGGAFTITATQDTFPLPTDYKRTIPCTQWDRRFQWSLIGPMSPQLDQWQRSGIPVSTPRRQWRKVGPLPYAFRIYPPPSSTVDYPGTLISEYISAYGVIDVTGASKLKFTADTDRSKCVPDPVLTLGTKWRFRQAKRFDYADLQAEYYNMLDTEQATDAGEPLLPLSSSLMGTDLIGPWNISDGNFPAS